MADNLVKFVYAASATAEQIAAFDANTIYFVGGATAGEGGKLYKGPRLYDAGAGATAAELAQLKTYIGTLPVDEQYTDLIDYIDKNIAAAQDAAESYADGAVQTLDNALAAVAKSGEADDVSLADANNKFTATDVEGALEELYDAIGDGETAAAVTVSKTTGGAQDDYVYRYVFSQGGTPLANGTIDIMKDMVATEGELVQPTAENPITIGGQTITSGTYIMMTIANGEAFYINVTDLIEYNAVSSTDEITLTDTNHTISATVGEISGDKIIYAEGTGGAEDITVNDKIADLEDALGDGIAALDGSATIASKSGNVVTLKSGISEVDGVVSNDSGSDITLAAVAVTGAASDVSYGQSTVSAALNTIGTIPSTATATTVVGYVDEKTNAAVAALDADLDASGTAQHSGTFVVSGVTQVDGAITAIDSVEVEAAGAAAAATAALIGASSDAASADTINGAKAYAADAVSSAVEALDADKDATGTALHSGTFVMNGVTQVDGLITSVDSVEVETAGAAAAAQAAAINYMNTALSWGSLPSVGE